MLHWCFIGLRVGSILELCWGYIGVILGLFWDKGIEDGSCHLRFLSVISASTKIWTARELLSESATLRGVEQGIYEYVLKPRPA